MSLYEDVSSGAMVVEHRFSEVLQQIEDAHRSKNLSEKKISELFYQSISDLGLDVRIRELLDTDQKKIASSDVRNHLAGHRVVAYAECRSA